MRLDAILHSFYALGSLWGAPTGPQVCVPGPHARPTTARAAAGAPRWAAAAKVTAFVDVTIIPMDTERVLAHQTVLVAGGRITALGPAASVTVPAGAERIDGRGRYLIPGLADMHAHLVTLGGGVMDDAIAERRLFSYTATGVTTIRNMDHESTEEEGARVLQLRAKAAAGEIVSPRIYTSGRWRTFLKGKVDHKEYSKTDRPEDVAPQIEAYKRRGTTSSRSTVGIVRPSSTP
jgi:imidazolonepropionase-like amidohydrolase